jgi:tRNA threonylcarbamoyladenosine biosynthesis protein TsaE
MTCDRLEWVSGSVEETREIARAIGSRLLAGDVIALAGPLGAGKTQFVKGLAAGLGVVDERNVNSPTFVLVQEYHGRLTLYHLDAYRLGSAAELTAIGFDEICDAGGVVVIEWADRVRSLVPDSAVWVELIPTGAATRRIELRADARSFARLIR